MASKTDFSFFQNVYDVVCEIPQGRVSTYGLIAAYLGSARSARMVGWAMNAAHAAEKFVPAHRVVNRMGLLSGKHHFGDENEMEQLLKAEGIIVVNNQIQNFKEILWDPSTELKL